MAGNSIGDVFTVTTFGESHGPAVGVVIDGVRPGLPLTVKSIMTDLSRRRPGTSDLVSSRREPDFPEILSGVFEDRTTGAPVCIIVRNHDANPSEYESVANLFRPGHGDFSWHARYGVRDWRGGGRQSGRETVGRVAAGAVARVVLSGAGVVIRAHAVEIGGISALRFQNHRNDRIDWDAVSESPVSCGQPDVGLLMEDAIRKAAADGDSVGGIVEVVAHGVPAGLGDPVFDKLDASLAGALMSIGGVKGVEIGHGFDSARIRGRDMVDEINAAGFRTNHAGGILGGISNGMPVIARVAVKPTPGISGGLHTVDKDGNEVVFERDGRSDPCIVPRIVPVVEAMAAIVLADALMSFQAVREKDAEQ